MGRVTNEGLRGQITERGGGGMISWSASHNSTSYVTAAASMDGGWMN